MQLSFFEEPPAEKSINNRTVSYREWFGYEAPPSDKTTKVEIEYLAGCEWFVCWIDCPDEENILEFFSKKQDAIKYANEKGYDIVNVKPKRTRI